METSRTLLRWRASAAALVAVFFGAGRALAQADAVEVEGTVVSLDAGDFIIDLGSAQGVQEGDVIELWRPLRLRHPVSGRPILDRFKIGSIRVTQVRRSVAVATADEKPTRTPAVGDVVVTRRAAAAKPPARGSKPAAQPAAQPAASSAAPPQPPTAPPLAPGQPAAQDPEAAALARMLAELRGALPELRAARYRAYAASWPGSKATPVLLEEAELLLAHQAGPEAPRTPKADKAFLRLPSSVLAGKPVHLSLELVGSTRGLVLHTKKRSELTYQSVPMEAAGQGYYRAVIPAELVAAPGVSVFVESVNEQGYASALVGTAGSPRDIEVVEPALAPLQGKGDALASLWADYANYNLKKHNDYVVQTEGVFGLRLGDEGLRAVRSGFGVYRGQGGTLAELDTLNLKGRGVGLTYGYLEGELAPREDLSFLGRLVIGLRDDGVSGGGQLYVRIGNDRRTNLLLGGEFLGGIGIRGITQLEWRTIPRIPIVLRTEVTNQPAGESVSTKDPSISSGKGEVGLRAIVQPGYELTPSLTLSGRVSYQGRTINHAGPGLGAAVTYQW